MSNSLLQGYSSQTCGRAATISTAPIPSNDPQFVTPVSPVGAPSLFGNLRLGDDSPLINLGSNSFVTGINTDLDGFSRINDDIVDLGPYENGNDDLFEDRFEN